MNRPLMSTPNNISNRDATSTPVKDSLAQTFFQGDDCQRPDDLHHALASARFREIRFPNVFYGFGDEGRWHFGVVDRGADQARQFPPVHDTDTITDAFHIVEDVRTKKNGTSFVSIFLDEVNDELAAKRIEGRTSVRPRRGSLE